MPPKGFSCLICTHRAPASLELLLDSLMQQEWRTEDEVILIDNGVAAKRLAELEKPLADLGAQVNVVLQREECTGLTNARLKAFSIAANPWYVLLDDDNALAPDALHRLRQCLGKHPDLGGICPQIQPIWQSTPAKWVVALGHQVLSYNSTRYSKSAKPFDIWKPGVKGARPPGGGMIVHRRAAEQFINLEASAEIVRNLGPMGERLSRGEDFFIYDFVYKLGLSTAYDESIIVYHHISSQRMQFGYLLRLLYHSNFSFGANSILRFGRWNILYSVLLRGPARLIYEFTKLTWSVRSWRLLFAFFVALCGYWQGCAAGFFDRRYLRLSLEVRE